MLPPADSIRIKVECLGRLLLKQLNHEPAFHASPQEGGCQKQIQKTVHNSGGTLGLIRKPVLGANGVVQSGGCLERNIGRSADANEFDYTRGRRKLVGSLAA